MVGGGHHYGSLAAAHCRSRHQRAQRPRALAPAVCLDEDDDAAAAGAAAASYVRRRPPHFLWAVCWVCAYVCEYPNVNEGNGGRDNKKRSIDRSIEDGPEGHHGLSTSIRSALRWHFSRSIAGAKIKMCQNDREKNRRRRVNRYYVPYTPCGRAVGARRGEAAPGGLAGPQHDGRTEPPGSTPLDAARKAVHHQYCVWRRHFQQCQGIDGARAPLHLLLPFVRPSHPSFTRWPRNAARFA